MSDADRLREDAARRMERRRRKMQSPEERLAKITGRLIEEETGDRIQETNENRQIDVQENDILVPRPIVTSTTPTTECDDPPLEHLTRDESMITNDNLYPMSGGRDTDVLSNLLSPGTSSVPSQPCVRYSNILWLLLAVVVRLMMDTEYSVWLADSVILPFLMVLSGLIITKYLDLSNLQSTSLLTAVLVLCGISQARVSLLTRMLHFLSIVTQSFSIYLCCFIVSHVLLEQIIDQLYF